MRTVGLGLALVASVQFAVAPAFAKNPPPPAATTTAPAKSAPVVTTTSATVKTAQSDAPAEKASEKASEKAAAPASAPGTVTVHINSPRTVTLEKRASATSPWEHVCNSPCDVATSTSDEYQILGEDLNASAPFILDASQGEKVTLDVTPGVHNKAARGSWILVGGAVLVVGGVITLLAGSKSNYVAGDNGTSTPNTNTDWIWVGSLLIAAGVIAGITGGSFMYDNAHTKVDGAIGDVPDKKIDVKAHATALRLPQWREDTGPQLAPGHFVSIFQGTF